MSKISGNPSAKKLLDQIQAVEAFKGFFESLPFASTLLPGAGEHLVAFNEIKKQADVLLVPDRFNDTFAQQGWIAYESMSLDAMLKAMEIEKEEGLTAGEVFLADQYDEDTLRFSIMRCSGHAEFRKRLRLIGLAKDDYLAERYHACVPLLLALLDGLVSDISKHVGFFAEGADMTAWDSIAAHETGLKSLAKIMGRGRNRTNEESISIPYRNGILHGRELAFDNKIVAAKCWAALFSIRDWAGALADGKAQPKDEKETSWSELFQQIADTEQTKKALAEWKPRSVADIKHLPCDGRPDSLPEGTPERTVAEFLANWCNQRYGPMAEVLLDYLDSPKGKKAGNAKRDFGCRVPTAYRVIEISEQTPAISQVEVDLVLLKEQATETVRVSVRLVYSDATNDAVIWGHGAGSWKIVQNGFGKVIYGW
jgi:hypothetical protein